METRTPIFEYTLRPGTGKAVPVLRGQMLRIEQLVGGQCADFNAFNLHDYKERFDAGRTRYFQSPWPTVGDHLWSAPPRDRPMLTIIADTGGGNDVTFQRCSAVMFEYQAGSSNHTNCQDILAEAISEYGLTPDDVHDTFNMFMLSIVDASGKLNNPQLGYVGANPSKRGDYIEMLAQIDALAVANVCGADYGVTSNFALNPLKMAVFDATSSVKDRWMLPERQFHNQRGPESFKVSEIKATRELVRDTAYSPEWPAYPIANREVEVECSHQEFGHLQALLATGLFGSDHGEVLKRAFFAWWIENRRRGPRVEF